MTGKPFTFTWISTRMKERPPFQRSSCKTVSVIKQGLITDPLSHSVVECSLGCFRWLYCLWNVKMHLAEVEQGVWNLVPPTSVQQTLGPQGCSGLEWEDNKFFLDCPHFPYWLMASLSMFRLLGVSLNPRHFTLIIPGFLTRKSCFNKEINDLLINKSKSIIIG